MDKLSEEMHLASQIQHVCVRVEEGENHTRGPIQVFMVKRGGEIILRTQISEYIHTHTPSAQEIASSGPAVA